MSAVNPQLAREIARRRTFAIISHPDTPLNDTPRHHASQILEKTIKIADFDSNH